MLMWTATIVFPLALASGADGNEMIKTVVAKLDAFVTVMAEQSKLIVQQNETLEDYKRMIESLNGTRVHTSATVVGNTSVEGSTETIQGRQSLTKTRVYHGDPQPNSEQAADNHSDIE